jgi:hypothetical protein
MNEIVSRLIHKAKTRKRNRNTIEWEKVFKAFNNYNMRENINDILFK